MKKTQTQQELLRSARKRLNVTNAALAGMLGKSLAALYAWLSKDSAPMHRTMPKGARMLLARIVADAKRKKAAA